MLNSTKESRLADINSAFIDNEIKAIFVTLGGDDQVTYINNISQDILKNNPKPFFGYSDNTHLINHLWKCGIPSYYDFNLFTQLGVPQNMDEVY